jgi:hypothetical protein
MTGQVRADNHIPPADHAADRYRGLPSAFIDQPAQGGAERLRIPRIGSSAGADRVGPPPFAAPLACGR